MEEKAEANRTVVFDNRDSAVAALKAEGYKIGTGPFKNRVYKKTPTGFKLVGKLREKK